MLYVIIGAVIVLVIIIAAVIIILSGKKKNQGPDGKASQRIFDQQGGVVVSGTTLTKLPLVTHTTLTVVPIARSLAIIAGKRKRMLSCWLDPG